MRLALVVSALLFFAHMAGRSAWAAEAGEKLPLLERVSALTQAGRTEEALALLKPALAAAPDDTDLLFALAHAHWRTRDLVRSLKAYDRILALTPGRPSAINQRLRMLSDLGAAGLALEQAEDSDIRSVLEPETIGVLENNMAARRLAWGEPHLATNILVRRIAAEPEPMADFRSRFDLVLALAAMRRHDELLALYEEMAAANMAIPHWVLDAAASSYLAAGSFDKSISLYRQALEADPDRFETRMGLYSALVEAGSFREAGEVLRKLEAETPEWRRDRGSLAYNWQRQEATVALGWWLAYQERLSSAQRYFDSWRQRAPANWAVRTAQGQIAVWRGQPRAGLEELDIVTTWAGEDLLTRPDYADTYEISVKNARIGALLGANRRREARQDVERLARDNPANRHTARLKRQIENLGRTRLDADYVATVEDPGVRDALLIARLTQPLTEEWSVFFQYGLRRMAGGDDDHDYERVGAGVRADLHANLTVESMASRDLKETDCDGVRTRVEWRLGDRWAVDGVYDTFTLDVPLRARAAGIDGERAEAGARFRSSEAFNVRGAAAVAWLSDDNEQRFYGLFAERSLIARAYVKTWLLGELSRTEHERSDVGYYSPEHSDTAFLTHRLDHKILQRVDRYWVHRLYAGAGLSRQAEQGRDTETIYDARYEHDFGLSDRTIFLLGVGYRRRYYDGEPTDVTSVYATLRKVF